MADTKRNTVSEKTADQVAEYLRKHPDFLDQRPELFSSLKLSHETPEDVSSLIERQVTVLRSENQRCRKQLRALSSESEALCTLTEQAHRLSLRMLQSEEPSTVCKLLHDFVYNDYQADDTTLFLFLQHNPFIATEIVEVRDRHDKLRLLLAELFNREQPLIDSLQAEHLTLMFGNAAAKVHSTVLLPLIGEEWDGLLVVGSQQRDRYRRGPDLELLVYLTRIAALQLDRRLVYKTEDQD